MLGQPGEFGEDIRRGRFDSWRPIRGRVRMLRYFDIGILIITPCICPGCWVSSLLVKSRLSHRHAVPLDAASR